MSNDLMTSVQPITFRKLSEGTYFNDETGVRIIRVAAGYLIQVPEYGTFPFLKGNGGWKNVSNDACATMKQARVMATIAAGRMRDEIAKAYDEASTQRPNPLITGECETKISMVCSGQGFQREDPLQMLNAATAFKVPKIQCDECYMRACDLFIERSHRR